MTYEGLGLSMADDNPFMGDGEGDVSLMPESHRPLRNIGETVTGKIPRGPLGFAGNGNLLGGASFFAVSFANTLNPLSGVDAGFNIEGSNVKSTEDGKRHTYFINAWSKDIAKFAAKIDAAPSLTDAAIRNIEVVSAEEETPRTTASTWRVVVDVKERQIDETINDVRNNVTEMT